MVSLIEPRGNAFKNIFAEELIKTARAIARPGTGILAADESTGTIGKRVSDTRVILNFKGRQKVFHPKTRIWILCLGNLRPKTYNLGTYMGYLEMIFGI